MEGVEGMITDFLPWNNVKQHVVSVVTLTCVFCCSICKLLNSADDVCALQYEVGNCRGSFTRFYYNKITRRCEMFSYGGCGGNANNFVNERDCIRTCQPGTELCNCTVRYSLISKLC